jgi:threonine dehydrogenase-like Zn-dependent dehydrogenase
MISAVYYGKNDIRIEETPMPEVKENEVLIKVMACGVCGTDIHIYEGDKGAADTPVPVILGHEFSGVVVKVGTGVASCKEGDRVCVDPNDTCGKCYYCRSGIGHFCDHMIGIGTTVNGGFSQYCSVNEKQVYHIADTTTFEEGAMSEPVACCIHGIDMCEIVPGSTVAVIGGGMIGLIMLQLSRLNGASRVILIEPVESKRAIGKELGADLCIDPKNNDVKHVLEQNGIHRVNAVIECVGHTATIEQAIDIAGKQSVVMMFGLTKPDEDISLKPFDVFKKEVIIKSSFINPYTIGRAVELINQHKIDVSTMVCDTIPLAGLEEVLSSAELRKAGKYIVNPWK